MFKDLGYYKEYYVNNKFIGTIKTEKDRDIIGYFGRKEETLNENITTQNNKIMKKGTKVTTILYPLCGELL